MPTKEEIAKVIASAKGFEIVVTVGDEEGYDSVFFDAGHFSPEIFESVKKELLRLNQEGKGSW